MLNDKLIKIMYMITESKELAIRVTIHGQLSPNKCIKSMINGLSCFFASRRDNVNSTDHRYRFVYGEYRTLI